jgi:hypothetical protein
VWITRLGAGGGDLVGFGVGFGVGLAVGTGVAVGGAGVAGWAVAPGDPIAEAWGDSDANPGVSPTEEAADGLPVAPAARSDVAGTLVAAAEQAPATRMIRNRPETARRPGPCR